MRLKLCGHMKTSAISLILFLLANSFLAFADDPTAIRSEADEYLSKLTAQEEFAGVVLVAKNGKVMFEKGYGMANREHEITNTANTIFRLGSVTKQFTAMCILILQEDEKLKVTDLISQHVEDCPEAWRAITIHHLLTHTSGIPSFTSFPDNLRFARLPTTVTKTVQRFRDRPLHFEPGTKMRYSNSGYVLLGHIIEKVSGESYDAFIEKKIFKPLGMKHSGYDHPAEILHGRASGYSKRGNDIVNCIPFAMDTPHAAGALRSTVGDLLTWDQSLYSGRLVSDETLDLMFKPFKGDYSYGWFCRGSGEHIQFSHSGLISGFSAAVVRLPEKGGYIVVLSNNQWSKSMEIAKKLSNLFFSTE